MLNIKSFIPLIIFINIHISTMGREIWHAINELILTEKNYVKQLQYVCENYKPEMDRDDIPAELRGRGYYLFGNIEKIYEFHRDVFCPTLEECNMDCQDIANTFMKFKSELYIYTLYAMNKPRSAKLMLEHGDFFKERQSEIGDRMGISSYLLGPIQRMIKYGQLIERITKNLKKLKDQGQETIDISELCGHEVEEQRIASTIEIIEGAGNTLVELQTQADDVQLITYVYNSPINLEIPHLLMTGKLIVNRKSMKYQVFLFDNMLLYAEPIQQESNEIFYYKKHLMLDEMDPPIKLQHSNTQFSITTGSKSTSSNTTYFKAANKEERDKWYNKIFGLLFQQLHDMKKSIDATKLADKTSIFGYNLPTIMDCQINLNAQGRVMKCGDVTITNEKNTYRGHILLFEKMLILTKLQNNVFSKTLVFQDSIDTTNLGMSPVVSKSPTQFNLWCTRTNTSYTVLTRSLEEKTAWTRRISDTLNSLEPHLSNQRKSDEFEKGMNPYVKSLRGVPGERKSKRSTLYQISQWYCD